MNPMSGYPASFGKLDFTPDKLIVGDDLVSRKVTLLSGENRTRGAVLGKITLGAATAAAKAGGNTGTGTFTLDVTTPILVGAKAGVYTARCITAAANGGTFRVEDPDGNVLGDVAVAATFADDIKFVIADGGVDFIVGDGFDITIAAGSGKYVLSLAAAVDGSQIPDAILLEDTNATAADADGNAAFVCDVDETALTLGAGHTLASIKEGLRVKGINLITPAVTG